MAEFAHESFTHTDGRVCIWLDDHWFVPLDAGGEGYGCEREHPSGRSSAESACTCAMTEASQRRCPQHGEDQHRQTEKADLQRRLYDGEKSAGWDPDDANTLAEEIAHLHEEISEAFRAFRATGGCERWFAPSGKPEGVPAEFADVVIGMFYIAERWGFDLLEAVEEKHRYNLRRSYAAEGRRLHEPSGNSSTPGARS